MKTVKILPRSAIDLQALCSRQIDQTPESFSECNGKLSIKLNCGCGQLSKESYNLGKVRRSGWNAIWICGKFAAVEIHNTGWGFCSSVKEAKALFAGK